jgi:hypothetical protein
MVYNTQNYCVFGLHPSSGILETRKHNVSETGSVSILKWGGKTPTQLGPLERANLNHWATPVRRMPSSGMWRRVYLVCTDVSEEHLLSRWLLTLVPRSRISLPWRWSNIFLRNFGSHKIYTAPHLRRRHSSKSPPWKPQILGPLSDLHSYLIAWHQANPVGDKQENMQ